MVKVFGIKSWIGCIVLVLVMAVPFNGRCATGGGNPLLCPSLVDMEQPLLLGESVYDVARAGSFAYLADSLGLTVVDVSDPANPVRTGGFLLPEGATRIVVAGNVAYLRNEYSLDYENQVWVVSILEPDHPVLVGSISAPAEITDVAVAGNMAYLAVQEEGIEIVDTGDPAHPRLVGTYSPQGEAMSLAISGKLLYIASFDSSHGFLEIVDLSTPSEPTTRGITDLPQRWTDRIVVGQGIAYALMHRVVQIVDTEDLASPEVVGSLELRGYGEDLALTRSLLQVTEESGGVEIFDVSDDRKPRLLGVVETTDRALGISAAGWTTYVSDAAAGLLVLDVSDPRQPVEISRIGGPAGSDGYSSEVLDLTVANGLAYVADWGAGVQVVDVSDPSRPRFVGNEAARAAGVAVSANNLYVSGSPGLEVFDLSDPVQPRPMGVWEGGNRPAGIEVSGDLLYLMDDWGLYVLDVTDPTDPFLLGFAGKYGTSSKLAVANGVAYVPAGVYGLYLFDVSDPSNLSVLGVVLPYRYVSGVAVAGDIAYVIGHDGLQLLDVSDPGHARLLSSISELADASGVMIDGDLALVKVRYIGLQVVDVSDPMSPKVVATVPTVRKNAPIKSTLALDEGRGIVWLSDGSVLEAVNLYCHTCPRLTVAVEPETVPAGGSAAVTVTLTDETGHPLAGRSLQGWADLGEVSPFTDNGDGSYTATFTSGERVGYDAVRVGVDGARCETTGEVHVVFAGSPVLGGPLAEHRYMIPGAAHVAGAAGTLWRSDVVLHNPGSLDASAAVFFLERDRDNTGTSGKLVEVPAGATVTLDDIVGRTFGRSTSGAIMIASDQPLVVSSRTFNDAPSGSYGQYVPGIPFEEGIGQGETARVIQLSRNARFRTNVGFANATGHELRVSTEAYRSDGTLMLGTEYLIPPFGYSQIADLLTGTVDDAVVVIRSDDPSARFFTYASVIDNRSGDPSFVRPVPASGGVIVVPAAAHVHGLGGTNWKSDLEVYNPGAATVSFSVALLVRDQANTAPASATFEVKAGESLRLTDVLDSVFHFSGAAALRITPSSGSLVVTSRTYNDAADGTYGQFIPGQSKSLGGNITEGVRLVQLSQSSSDGEGFRTNIGLANTKARATEVNIELFDGDGEPLGGVRQTLGAYEYVQIDRIFRRVTSQNISNGFALISSPTAGASVLAYASAVDNRSGDPINVPPVP